MNRTFVFFLGFIVGGIFVSLVIFLGSFFTQTTLDFTKSHINQKKFSNIQYTKVVGRNGEVVLHNQMPKDSVKLLLGEPTSSDLYSIGTDTHEIWRYEFPEKDNGSTRYLRISFTNGKIVDINN
ncbi:MAG: DUF2845 domain-containing protein [Clostridium sp.]|nr:DUF2845 domain-containing protein [Prevotella sp.]MCM1429337.1 DUF2845 domain-containing protein [Clostridium sp.]MCM1475629.1 DUF2845 domain-containing protein [Muribaculaceae bacterium]